MAPNTRRGGPNQRTPHPPSRAASRGGVAKRSSGRPVPTDRDGDLDMDAAGARSNARRPAADSSSKTRRGGGAAKAPTRASARVKSAVQKHLDGEGMDSVKRKQDVPLIWLDVRGLAESKAANNPGGGIRDLLSFLERKATGMTQRAPPVVVKKHQRNGGVVEIGATREDAEELIKLNDFVFAGAKLVITDSNGSLASARQSKASTEELKNRLTNVLSLRYDIASKLLKLDGLGQDAELVGMGFLESKDRAEKLIAVMMKICDDLFKTNKEKTDNIHSISLANNGITSVQQVESVAETFPDLLNLDLSGNAITKPSDLARWKGKFRKLSTLYVTNNPLNIADPKVRAELIQFFPKLNDINGEKLTPEHLEQLRTLIKPRPIPQHGPDFRDVNGRGEEYLVALFSLFDTDRRELLARYYDDESQFSLSVDTNAIRDMDVPALPWAQYIQKSRNLTRITSDHGRRGRLHTGREAILTVWNDLPPTKHPDIKTETAKFIMDCHLLPGLVDPHGQSASSPGLILLVHGHFEEIDKPTGKQGMRSFSRSIVLGPGKPGGGDIRVISDMLSLRSYNALPNVLAAPAAPVTSVAPGAPPVTQLPQDEQLQQAKIAELCKQTNMTPEYSRLCLQETGWDFDRALAVFNEKRSELPPAAFAGP